MAHRFTVLNDNTDLIELGYIDNLPKIVEKKTFNRDKTFTNQIRINANNHNGFFSIGNPDSNFSGERWKYGAVKWYDENNDLIWDGVLIDILPKYEPPVIAQIISENILSKYFAKLISYESADWETPADAFKNICDDIGFTHYNMRSIVESRTLYEQNDCYIKS